METLARIGALLILTIYVTYMRAYLFAIALVVGVIVYCIGGAMLSVAWDSIVMIARSDW